MYHNIIFFAIEEERIKSIRAKNQGNLGEGETIARAIDLESSALILFYDTEIEPVSVINPTSLDFALDGVLI